MNGGTGMGPEDWLGDERPSSRADPLPVRERTGIRMKGAADFSKGEFTGELEVTSEGPGRSPQARAVTTLIVALAAGACAFAVAGVCLLAHVPAAVFAVASLVVFTGVLVTGLVLAFGEKPPVDGCPTACENLTRQHGISASRQLLQHKRRFSRSEQSRPRRGRGPAPD